MSQQFESKQNPGNSARKSHQPERRRSARGEPQGEPARAHLVALILGTYADMPGLSLRLYQAARLFGLRQATCQVILTDLVTDGRLRQSADNQYRAANSAGGGV
jgi:hypothetical protein